jgi:hypothetical protein
MAKQYKNNNTIIFGCFRAKLVLQLLGNDVALDRLPNEMHLSSFLTKQGPAAIAISMVRPCMTYSILKKLNAFRFLQS